MTFADSATWGRQLCTTANFFSRGGCDRPYFLMFLAGTEASLLKKHLSKATKDLLDTLHLSFSTMKKNVYNPIVHHGGPLLLLELLWHFDPG